MKDRFLRIGPFRWSAYATAISLLFPTLFFVSCWPQVHRGHGMLRSIDIPPLPPGCRAPELYVDAIRVSVAIQVGDQNEFPTYQIDPQGYRDEDWVAHIDLKQPLGTQCNYGFYAFDFPRMPQLKAFLEDPTTFFDAKAYRHVACQQVAADHLSCHLQGRPWRSYLIVPVWKMGPRTGIANRPAWVSFCRTFGLNIRGHALVLFALQLLVAACSVYLLWRYRPGGLHGDGLKSYPRPLQVLAMGAYGGFVSGALFMLRPPDVGGYDEPRAIIDVVVFAPLIGMLIGVSGLFFDWLRRATLTHRRREKLLLILPAMVFASFFSAYLGTQFSAYTGPTLFHPWTSYKRLYYMYFGLATALPLVLVPDPTEERRQEQGAGSVYSSDQRFALLFGLAALNGLLATAMAIACGGHLQVETGQAFYGFYKPASGWGLWLVTLPMLTGLSLGLSLGDARPRWVQDLCRLLEDRAAEYGVAQIRLRRAILRQLVQHASELGRQGHHLRAARNQLLDIVESINPADVRQLAEELGHAPDRVTRCIATLQATLNALPEPIRTEETALLLLCQDASSELQEGRLEVRRLPELGHRYEARIQVFCNGHGLTPEERLSAHVRAWVGRLSQRYIAPSPTEQPAFAGERLEVHFTQPDEEDGRPGIDGRSYELPLALLLWKLAHGSQLIYPRIHWLATGAVGPLDFELEPIHGLAEKVRVLAYGPPTLLLTSADSVARERERLPPHVACLVVDGEQRKSVEALRRALQEELSRGRSVVVGLKTLAQAIYLLFDEVP